MSNSQLVNPCHGREQKVRHRCQFARWLHIVAATAWATNWSDAEWYHRCAYDKSNPYRDIGYVIPEFAM